MGIRAYLGQRIGLKLAAMSIIVLGGCAAMSPATHSNYDLAISGVTVIDAVGGARPNQTVAIRGDSIAAVVDTQAFTGTATRSIDGAGQYLIPGLWDMHVHVTYEDALTGPMPDLFLDYGVTSVRDTGGLLPKLVPVVEQWRAPETIAPRIYYSGPLLDGTKVVYDGDDRPEIGIANPTSVQAVENLYALIAAGVDFIKIYELVSPEVFSSLVAAAAANDLPIAAHVPLSLTADEAGPQVQSMEHLRNIELACSNRAKALHKRRAGLVAAPGDLSGYALRSKLHAEQRPRALGDLDIAGERCQRVIASLANTIQVPTIRLNTIFEYSPLERADWLASLADLPAELAQQWQATAERFLGKGSPVAIQTSQWSLALVAELHRRGVPIGAGTDTPIGQAIPGYSLHTELERLVEAGLPPLEALRAATVRPAEFLRLESQLGTIEPGKWADLVLLRENPLEDIRNTRTIEMVIANGRLVRE